VKSPSPSFLSAPSGTGSCSKVTLEPSLLQAEQPQLPQPVLIGEVRLSVCIFLSPCRILKSALRAACMHNELVVMDMQRLWKPLLLDGRFLKRKVYALFQMYLWKSAAMHVYFSFVQCQGYPPVNFITVLFAETPSTPFSVPEE